MQDVDEEVITKFISRADLLFLSHFPVTPNNHRVTEIAHAFSNGQRLIFVKLLFSFTALSQLILVAWQIMCFVVCFSSYAIFCTELTIVG